MRSRLAAAVHCNGNPTNDHHVDRCGSHSACQTLRRSLLSVRRLPLYPIKHEPERCHNGQAAMCMCLLPHAITCMLTAPDTGVPLAARVGLRQACCGPASAMCVRKWLPLLCLNPQLGDSIKTRLACTACTHILASFKVTSGRYCRYCRLSSAFMSPASSLVRPPVLLLTGGAAVACHPAAGAGLCLQQLLTDA